MSSSLLQDEGDEPDSPTLFNAEGNEHVSFLFRDEEDEPDQPAASLTYRKPTPGNPGAGSCIFQEEADEPDEPNTSSPKPLADEPDELLNSFFDNLVFLYYQDFCHAP